MRDVPGISSFKIGSLLSLEGLAGAVRIVRGYRSEFTTIIYDHQKWGNDIPEMGKPFAERLVSLLSDEGLRRRLGAAAASSIGPEFDIDGMVRSQESLYETLAAARHG